MPFPSTVAAIVAVVALGFLLRDGRRSAPPPHRRPTPGPATRRRRALPRLGRRCRRARRARRGRRHPAPVRRPRGDRRARRVHPARSPPSRRPPIPAGAELGIAGPRARHHPERASSTASTPRCRSRASTRPPGRCAITGEVENEIELTWDELIALPLEESVTTLMCVSNEVGGDLIGNALWLGYPIREVLEAGEAEGRRRHGALAQHRRVHRGHPARRCCRRRTATRSSRSA